jgi:hypothetical protein
MVSEVERTVDQGIRTAWWSSGASSALQAHVINDLL